MKQSVKAPELIIDPYTRPGFVIGRTRYLFRTKIIEALRSSGSNLNPEEAWLLMVIDEAGGTVQTGAIRNVMQRDPSTLTRQLDQLCNNKFARRERDMMDGRIVNVILTAKGRSELNRVMPAFEDLRERAVAGISKEDLNTMTSALLRIQNNLQNSKNRADYHQSPTP